VKGLSVDRAKGLDAGKASIGLSGAVVKLKNTFILNKLHYFTNKMINGN